MLFPPEKTCCFTGHRPGSFSFGYQEDDPALQTILHQLTQQIGFLCGRGVVHFLTGMAQGVDTWAALQVLSMKMHFTKTYLTCVLPCPQQDARWSQQARERYREILRRADAVITVSEAYHPGCMRQRNQYLVDHASYVLSVYNGDKRSGTAQTLRYAQQKGRAISLIVPGADAPTPFTRYSKDVPKP